MTPSGPFCLVALFWLAHTSDLSVQTTGSGNMHGMPLAFLSGLVDPTTVPGCEWLPQTTPQFNPSEALVYVGLRDIDIGERAILRNHNIKTFTMAHVDRYGIGKARARRTQRYTSSKR
jgi:arginase